MDQVGTTRKTIFNPVINKIAYFSDRYSSDFGVVESVDISSGAPIYTEASVYGYTTIYNSVSACYDPDTQQFIVVAPEQNNGYVGTAVVMSLEDTNLSGSNYIGISDGAYSDGETATIKIAGAVDDAQSSLKAGLKYYVQIDGSLSATSDIEIVEAGTAISATELIVKG